MLQWTGGSRRKVTDSKKSIQKRQQQYFEQRRRQQQQKEATNVDNHNDRPVAYAQQMNSRSLDILNILNASKVAEECRSARASELKLHNDLPSETVTKNTRMITKRAPCAKDSEVVEMAKYMRSPIAATKEVAAADHVKPTAIKSGTLSSHQGEMSSSKSTRKNTSMARNAESKCWGIDSSNQTSIFDIIDDEGPTDTSKGKHVKEAHLAFSIEGLGFLGTETPKQSPQQPARISCDDKSSLSKAAKKQLFRKQLNMLDGLEMETDTEEPNFGIHLDPFLISDDVPSSLSYFEHERSPVKAYKKHSPKHWAMNSPYQDRDPNFWNAGSSFLDDDIVNEKYKLNLKNGGANIPRNVSPVFGSREPQLLPRFQENNTGRYDFLDEGDRLFCSFEEPKCSSFMRDYKRQATCSSPYMDMDDRTYNLTSLSEESRSSTAVRGRKAGNPYERPARRYDEDLPWQLNSNMQDVFQEEAEGSNRSRKYSRSNARPTTSAYMSRGMLNKRDHLEDRWLPESGFMLDNTDTVPDFFIPASGKRRHRTPERDPFGTTNVQDDYPPKYSDCSSSIFEKRTCGEFSPENVAFFQPFHPKHSFNTPFSVGGNYNESSYGVVQSPNLADEVIECFGDTEAALPVPESSAQASVTQEVGDEHKSMSDKKNQSSAQSVNTSRQRKLTDEETNRKDNGSSSRNEKDGSHKAIIKTSSGEDAEETSSPAINQHAELNTTEVQTALQMSFLGVCQEHLKVSVADVNCFVTAPVNSDESDDLNGFEAKALVIESSCQVMTVERYAFRLFCSSRKQAAMCDTTNRLL